MKKFILILLLLLPMYANANSTCDGMWAEHTFFQLTNGHAQGKCSCASCHIGSFSPGSAGGGTTCNSCHMGSRPAAMMKPSGHIPTQGDCGLCHTTTTFGNARMNHTGIVTGCASCHSKKIGHVVTSQPCENCHNTNSNGWKCISGKLELWLKTLFA